MVVLGRIKLDSGTKKQVSESNSNLMPLVSRITGWAFIGARSPYVIGKRSSDWLKIKVAHTADFEVIGCVPMRGEKAITVLLLGENIRAGWYIRARSAAALPEGNGRISWLNWRKHQSCKSRWIVPLGLYADCRAGGAEFAASGWRKQVICEQHFPRFNMCSWGFAPLLMSRLSYSP